MQYIRIMKILTLFLALLLSLLPEGTPVANCSPGEDVCYEVVDDVEEEAVIRTSQTPQKQPRVSSTSVSEKTPRDFSHLPSHFPVHLCFERKWLTAGSFRL